MGENEKAIIAVGTLTESSGAVYKAIYAERRVMTYAVTDHELNSLSLANAATTALFSAMTFCLTLATSIWIGVAVSGVSTSTTEGLTKIAAPICCVLALIFLILGLIFYFHRRGDIDRIRKQST
jgi:hypothetical protein